MQWDFAPQEAAEEKRHLPRNLSLTKKRNIWGIRRDMPKKEADLTALENEETAGTENSSADIAETPGADAQGEETTVGRAELEQLKADYDQLKKERDALLERLARLQAEFENARKRAEKEKADFKDFAVGSVVEQFLPVLDNFELALKSTGSLEQLRAGVELIVKQMEEILRGMQVQPVATVGEEFDPRHHEAMGSVEREDMPDQHVAEEVRRGYRLREKLLRPALVRVVSNPKQTSE
jgi:molecular chaperone GrpE